MTNETLLILLDEKAKKPPAAVGRKAENLHRLMSFGVKAPRTYVIPWQVYQRYLNDDLSVVEELRNALTQNLHPEKNYAVRSSANLEDHFEQSFAGQFKTVLNVNGIEAVMQAVWSIWGTVQSASVEHYLQRLPSREKKLQMAVIVQEMVKPVVSGVVFSRNPMTGLDEIIIEAVKGEGTQLVQQGATPFHWVYKWGNWLEAPEDNVISKELIRQVVEQTQKLAKRWRTAIDLEWVYDGKELYWVQCREITTLKNLNIYSNRISRDMLPGIIKPLIWSVNIPLVNGAWIRLLTELVGENDIKPEDLAKSFYYRAYFNMSTLGHVFRMAGFPEQSLEMMNDIAPKEAGKPAFRPGPKTLRLIPRLIQFAWGRWNFATRYKREVPPLLSQIEAINWQQAAALSDHELLEAINHLYRLIQQLAYFNINVPLLMMMYNAALKSQLTRLKVDYAQFDLEEDLSELQEYNPNFYLKRLSEIYQQLDEEAQTILQQTPYERLDQVSGAEEFSRQLNQFLLKFGHLSDSGNDFSVPPWRENPALILKLIFDYPATAADRIKEKVHWKDLRINGLQRIFIGLLYRRARQFRIYREQISSRYTYSYGLFRQYFLEIGRRLVQRNLLDTPDDIFYLTWDEVKSALEKTGNLTNYREVITKHKKEIERLREVELPTIIYGDTPPPVKPPDGHVLRGTATSRGYYRGPVCVVRGIQDFYKVKDGDVLVVPYSDVGWTPLFSRAGAVVAESGGMLSHSSIIAREYGIPAVVSVTNATRLIDGILVIVDGFKGEVILESPYDEGAEHASPDGKQLTQGVSAG